MRAQTIAAWIRITALSVLLFSSTPAMLNAQDPARGETGGTQEVGADTVDPVPADTDSLDGDMRTDNSSPGPEKPSAAMWSWSKDSIRLIEYHHIGEIAEHHPAVQLYSLGNYGQPGWIGTGGSSPWQSTITVNGIPDDDLLTSLPDLYRIATEDAGRITVYPQYQAFWYGTPGDILVVNVEEKEWDAPRPVTRLRHTEAANEYLFTDAMFSLNTSESEHVLFALTRTSIGSSNNNNAARFENNRHESWNIRFRYRNNLSQLLRTALRVQYDDQISYLNSGIRGNWDRDFFPPHDYPQRADDFFTDAAFDPKSAELIDPSIFTHRQHYKAEAALRLKWTEDSTQMTTLRVTADSDVRRYRDATLGTSSLDHPAEPRQNLTDHWTLLQATLDHQTQLEWAELELQGNAGRYSAIMGGNTLQHANIVAHARGNLRLQLGPFGISGFGRLDHRFASSTISIGAGTEIPFGPLRLWAGASVSTRPHTLIERMYTSPRLTVHGNRTPDLDNITILEGGLRLETHPLTIDIRGFARRELRHLELRTSTFTDSLLGRYSLELRELPGGRDIVFSGGSADVGLSLWRFHIRQQVSLCFTDGYITDRFAPRISSVTEFAYRGMLIEGTLDLRAGARFSYAQEYTPLLYHPETGMFLPRLYQDPALRSFSDVQRLDLFLFATIKQRATLHVIFHNILDHRYITTGFYPMFDRALRFGVDWVFFD